MKIKKSTIARTSSIGELPAGKITISLNGSEKEGIWVAKDEENKVMYLLNHAIMFYPFPTWGMELPLQDEIDLFPYRGESIDDTEFTVCEEAYEVLKQFINEETNEFDVDMFIAHYGLLDEEEEEEEEKEDE